MLTETFSDIHNRQDYRYKTQLVLDSECIKIKIFCSWIFHLYSDIPEEKMICRSAYVSDILSLRPYCKGECIKSRLGYKWVFVCKFVDYFGWK